MVRRDFFEGPCYPSAVASNLTVTTPATSRILIQGAELLERLSLASGDTAKAARLAARASAEVIRVLGFELGYQTVSQEFFGETGDSLDLSARPFVALVSVLDSAGTALVAGTDFQLRRTGRASGEAYLYRPDTWATYEPAGVVTEWTVNYRAGWWLPEMSGAAPVGVQLLPGDLTEAAFVVARDLYGTESTAAGIESMSKGDSKVVFRATGGEKAPRQNGIPAEAFDLIAPFRPIAF